MKGVSLGELKTRLFFMKILGHRSLNVFKSEVDIRLRYRGLQRLIVQATGEEPSMDEAYAFCIKNRDLIRILIKDETGLEIVELKDETAVYIKGYFQAY